MENNQDFTIDGIKLDPENKEFKYALDCVQYTNQLIYLTGKAGTGKTTFLKYLRKVTNKKMVVLAPTGVAAVNAKGQTIHSFFHIPPTLFVPNDKKLHENFYDTFKYKNDHIQIIKNLELLVIDEVSMVRCDLIDVIDIILQTIRKNTKPFGGVQVLLIGDTFQLPPVVDDKEKSILYQFYKSEFFFSAKVMRRVKPLYIELKKIYRQKEKEFIDLLNRIRVGQQDKSDIQLLNSKINLHATIDEEKDYIYLTTTNNAAACENRKKLEALQSKPAFFDALIEDNFPKNNYPTDARLELKEGAQVMFIKNNWNKGYFNGKIGKVAGFNDDSIVIDVTDADDEIRSIVIEPFTWENIEYEWNDKEKKIEERIVGTFTQYPLKLAWAITVHKSQGMTFDKVIADVGYSFAAGQVYVALSRCTSMNGLILKSRITPQAIKTDYRVIEFSKNEVPETLLMEELQQGKADYYYAKSRTSFKSGNAEECYDNFVKALKHRNDIETDLFKRYFCVLANRYYQSDANINKIITKYEKLNKECVSYNADKAELLNVIETKERKLVELNETISNFDNVVSKQKQEIEKLRKETSKCKAKLARRDNTLKIKDNNIHSLNDKLIKNQANNDELKSELATQNQKIESLNFEIKKLSAMKESLEQNNTDLLKEIERVKGIKWYQKLFGKE